MTKINKQIFILILFLITGISFTYARSFNDSKIGVVADTEGSISEIDSLLLNGVVKDKLESNLKKYSSITIVSTNIPELKNLQKDTQQTGIDKNTAVRMGKIMAADSLLQAMVRKGSSGYAVSVKFIDLTTGEVLATVQEKANDSDSIWTGAGCAVDLLTIDLCDAIGIDLSPSQKYILRYGEKDLTTDEQLKLFKSDSDRYEKLIQDYNKEISLLDYSTEIDAKEKQIAIQALREIAEQQLASSVAARQRLEELKKIQLEEEKKDVERTETQKKKRAEIEALAKKKVAELRNEKKNKTTAIEEIAYIENEKRAYIQIRDSVNSRIEEIDREKNAEIEQAKAEINARPYRKAHLDSEGNPIPEAKELRREEIAARAAEIRAAKSLEIDNVKKSVSSNMKELLSIIDTDSKKLAKAKRKASSVTDELSVVMGLYDGAKRAWTAHLYFTVDGRDLYHQEMVLSYETVTGKKVTNIMDPDYLDTVDLYDSIFSRGTQIIVYELQYSVQAMPKDRPSVYSFNFETLILKDVRQNLKTIKEQSLNNTKYLHISPAYDIRSEEEIAFVAVTEERQQKKQAKKQETKKKLETKKYERYAADLDFVYCEPFADVGASVSGEFSIGGPFFIGGKLGVYIASEYLFSDDTNSEDYDSGILFLGYIGLGVPIRNDFSNIYLKAGIGGAYNYVCNGGFLYSFSAGINLSLIQLEYGYDYFADGATCSRVSIGFSFAS